MGVPKRLTEMQMRFAEFVVFGGTEGPMTQGPKQPSLLGMQKTVRESKDHNS